MDCSPCSTGTVASVKSCSQSSADSGSTPVEHPSSLATVKACSQSSADSGLTPVETQFIGIEPTEQEAPRGYTPK